MRDHGLRCALSFAKSREALLLDWRLFVEGIMQGEAMRKFENEQVEPAIFDIH
jgi:hypothetical protein